MKHDSHLPSDPELEARIVAWVLGEASPFEIAELERHLAAEPALAIFKRRIEAVHGLVQHANRAPSPQLRLSPQRRAKLLATIGAEGETPSAPQAETLYPLVGKRTRWKVPVWAYSAAACLMLGLFIAAELTPRYGSAIKPRWQESGGATTTRDREAVRPAELPAIEVEQARKDAAYRDVDLRQKAQPERREQDAANSTAQTPTDTDVPAISDQIVLKNNAQYGSAPTWSAGSGAADVLTLAGSPAAQNYYYSGAPAAKAGEESLLSAARDALTKSKGQLTFGVKDVDDRFIQPKHHIGSVTLGIMASDGTANNVATVGGTVASGTLAVNATSNTVASASVAPSGAAVPPAATIRGLAAGATAATNDSTDSIKLSPFEVRADRDYGYLASNTIAGSRVNTSLADVGSQVQADTKKQLAERFGKVAPAAEAKVEAGKTDDAPLAHPPAPVDETLRAEASTKKEAVSTFSLHVSDVSFRLAAAALNRGERPDAGSIRPEEFYNAFDYGDPAPVQNEAVACRIEQAAHPFLPQRNLVRIALKVPATGRGATQPLRLTVLLDTSGSMEREDRVAAVRRAFASLASLLGPADTVTLIGFARQPRLLADRVTGDRAATLNDIIARTPAEGGTNLEEALKLAGDRARVQFSATAQNRIVLLTDGAANLGNANPVQLAKQITALRQQGIAFDACGVGIEGLDDSILEALTRQGDGRYYVINSPEEADASFARKLAGAFRPAAENVKVQVRFNPARVGAYRLIGFEQHRLQEQDFRNDKVDAAELAAEEAAVALYQVEIRPEGEGELGEVFVRFRTPGTAAMVERSWTLPYQTQVPAFDRATPSLQLAGTAAFVAEKLRGGGLAAQIQLREFAPIVNGLRGHYANNARVQEFVTLFAQARKVIGE